MGTVRKWLDWLSSTLVDALSIRQTVRFIREAGTTSDVLGYMSGCLLVWLIVVGGVGLVYHFLGNDFTIQEWVWDTLDMFIIWDVLPLLLAKEWLSKRESVIVVVILLLLSCLGITLSLGPTQGVSELVSSGILLYLALLFYSDVHN